MKLAKRILTAGVALALTLSLNIPAFAATITVNNAAAGETYTAYKLFDVTTATVGTGDDATTSYSYTTTNSDLVTTLEDYVVFSESAAGGTWTATGLENDVSSADLAAYLSGLDNLATLLGNGTTATVPTGQTSVTLNVGNNPGYYFVDSTLGSLCILNTAADEATVEEKNSMPIITKNVQEDSTGFYGETATIDGKVDTIYYQLTVNTGTGYSGLGTGVDGDYTITDVLPAGIAYNNGSVALPEGWSEYNADTQEGDYTVNYDAKNNTLTIVLKASKLASLGHNADIMITYNAKASANITVGTTGHTNTVTLVYKNQSMEDEAVVKTYDIANGENDDSITKVDATTNEPLEGVKFILSKGTGEATRYAQFDSYNYLTAWVTSQDEATELVTDANGHINALGLDADTYSLIETETLPGYNLLDEPITVVIAADGSVTYTGADATNATTINIKNQTGSLLPPPAAWAPPFCTLRALPWFWAPASPWWSAAA